MEHWSSTEATAAATLQLIAQYTSDVIARIGPDMRFRYISPSTQRLFKRTPASAIGQLVTEYVLPEDLPLIAEATRRVLAGEADDTTVTIRVLRGDGVVIWVEVASRLIGEDACWETGDRALVMRDVSDRKALEEQLLAMAMKDGLTGLANRRAFDEALVREWERTVREKSHMSLLLLDIDHFKLFNDAHGHQVGDDCLRGIASALQTVVRGPADIVARYGGEELVIILPGADAAAAGAMAARACAVVEALALPQAPSIGGAVTVSIGVATAMARDGGSAEMPHALLAAADRALYKAKDSGRNRWMSTLLLASTRG